MMGDPMVTKVMYMKYTLTLELAIPILSPR